MNWHGLHIGINYKGTASELAGCVPDARNWYKRLLPYMKTSTLIEENKADRAGIERAAERIKKRLDATDRIALTISCHGTWERTDDPSEPSGGNQGIVCRDFHVLWDDQMAALFEGVSAFAVVDCCHSASIHRTGHPIVRPRCIPIERCRRESRAVSGLHMQALPNCWGFRACGDGRHDYAYDAWFHGKAAGAMSYYTLRALDRLKPGATFRQWFRLVGGKRPKGYLPSIDYPQTPHLVGTRKYLDMAVPFIR